MLSLSGIINKPVVKRMLFTTGFLLSSLSICGKTATVSDSHLDNDSVRAFMRESIFPEGSISLAKSHFTWGAEVGASIDITGYDMSTFDVDAVFGYKNSFIKLLGVGAGIHRTVQHGNNFIPIYATIQTSFRNKPSLLFFSAKFGYSFNTINESPTFGDFVSSIGCGVNLSKSKVANTYMILGVGYRYFNERHKTFVEKLDTHYVYIAQLSFGISF